MGGPGVWETARAEGLSKQSRDFSTQTADILFVCASMQALGVSSGTVAFASFSGSSEAKLLDTFCPVCSIVLDNVPRTLGQISNTSEIS